MKIIINLVNKFLNMFNAQLIKKSFFDQLINQQEFMLLLTQIENKQRSNFIDNLLLSKSQLRQDLFVLSELEFKKNGYFVDFGATNGCDISNSYFFHAFE